MAILRASKQGEKVRGYGRAPLTASSQSIEERVGANITPQPNGCWTYRGRQDQYAHTKINGELFTIHRYVYETLVGPIDEGCHLHHKCENKRCCNPAHLEPLTPKEHVAAHKALRQSRPS